MKEIYFELEVSVRCHVILVYLCFLFLELFLVSRQRGFLDMSHFLLEFMSICQVIIHGRHVVDCDVMTVTHFLVHIRTQTVGYVSGAA